MNLNPFTRLRAWFNKPVLDRLAQIEIHIHMKLSQIKSDIAAASKRSTEAFAEISARIADQQKKIDDLLAGVSDPEVTDDQFLADLQALKTTTDQLADIVPAAPDAATKLPEVPSPVERITNAKPDDTGTPPTVGKPAPDA